MEQKHTPQILKLAEKRTISARTNAEFLNEVVGTNYKQWYKSGYILTCNTIIWMPRINGENHSDWINIWVDNNTIHEEYVGNSAFQDTRVKHPYRIVAEIIDDRNCGRKYKICGIFKYIKEESTTTKHIWKRDV